MIDDHDDHDHEHEFQPGPDDIQKAHAKAEQLAEVAQKFGLYQQHFDLGVAKNGQDGLARMTVISMFTTGDITWTDRILNPEEADLNDEFIVMRTAMEEDEFEEYRARLERKMKGEDPDGE